MKSMTQNIDFKGLTPKIAAATLLIVAAFSVGTISSDKTAQASSDKDDALTWHGAYKVQVERDGEVIAEDYEHNTLTTQGQNWIRAQIADVSFTGSNDLNNATFISLGNGSDVSGGDTVLDKEITTGGLSRASGTPTKFGAGEFQVQNEFTASSDIGTVNTTGLNYASGSGNDLISGGAFSAEATILSGDKLTVTHNITIS